MYLKFFKLEEKTFYAPEKYLINLTKVYTFPYIINQLTVIDEYTRHKYMELAMVATVNHLSCHIYQYYCYKMLLFHRVVIGHSQYHSTDTRNTSLGRILQKISCVPRVILGLDRCIQSSTQKTYFTS